MENSPDAAKNTPGGTLPPSVSLASCRGWARLLLEGNGCVEVAPAPRGLANQCGGDDPAALRNIPYWPPSHTTLSTSAKRLQVQQQHRLDFMQTVT
jgi:hypothetical protein